jgi:isochorismate synthase
VISLAVLPPAVCGLPKQEAKDFILENEYDRNITIGFLGELNKEAYLIKRLRNLICMSI